MSRSIFVNFDTHKFAPLTNSKTSWKAFEGIGSQRVQNRRSYCSLLSPPLLVFRFKTRAVDRNRVAYNGAVNLLKWAYGLVKSSCFFLYSLKPQICLKGLYRLNSMTTWTLLYHKDLERGRLHIHIRETSQERRGKKDKDTIHTEGEYNNNKRNAVLHILDMPMFGRSLKITEGDTIERNEWVRRCVKPPERQHISTIWISVCNYL